MVYWGFYLFNKMVYAFDKATGKALTYSSKEKAKGQWRYGE